MLVTFTCKTHENIMMFGEIAVRLIKMMGHSGDVPGAILAEDVPLALNHLSEALVKEPHKNPVSASEDEQQEVSLAHRAVPLIHLLNNAITNKCNVMWK